MVNMLACGVCFLIGSCWTFMTFAEDIKREWNATISFAENNRVKFKKRIYEYIEFHSSVKQLGKPKIYQFFPYQVKFKTNIFSGSYRIIRTVMRLPSRHFVCGVFCRFVVLSCQFK